MTRLELDQFREVLRRVEIVKTSVELAMGQCRIERPPAHADRVVEALRELATWIEEQQAHNAHVERMLQSACAESTNARPGVRTPGRAPSAP